MSDDSVAPFPRDRVPESAQARVKAKKNIVICCDGTWNEPDEHPTNVVKLMRALRPTHPESGRSQIVYYDEGVGTHWGLDKVLGGAFGIGLSENIKQAYRFIANNYEEGDQIYCFGFSRGAFTVRSLGGLLGVVGLLPKIELDDFERAYAYYRLEKEERRGSKGQGLLKKLHPRTDVEIHFMGVWDTVGALGIPLSLFRGVGRSKYAFHDTELGDCVTHARQALAIDERRGDFAPAIWIAPPDRDLEKQTLEQVWFVGAHSNIGGGYEDSRLSDIALIWMIEQAEAQGLAFDDEYFKEFVFDESGGRPVDTTAPLVYRLKKKLEREIGRADRSNEAIHGSVLSHFGEEGGESDYRNRDKVEAAIEQRLPLAEWGRRRGKNASVAA